MLETPGAKQENKKPVVSEVKTKKKELKKQKLGKLSRPRGKSNSDDDVMFEGGFVDDKSEQVSQFEILTMPASKKVDTVPSVTKKSKKTKQTKGQKSTKSEEESSILQCGLKDRDENGEGQTRKSGKKGKKNAIADSGDMQTLELTGPEIQKTSSKPSPNSSMKSSPKSNKKKETKKRAALNGDLIQETIGSLHLFSEGCMEKDHLQSPISKDKAKKRRSFSTPTVETDCSVDSKQSSSCTTSKSEQKKSPKSASKKSKKGGDLSKKVDMESCDDGDIEILIANKKYKGPEKEAFEKARRKSMEIGVSKINMSTEKKKKVTEKISAFAVFCKTKTPPAAFVRKALLKAATPQSEPRKRSKKVRGSSLIIWGGVEVGVKLHFDFQQFPQIITS